MRTSLLLAAAILALLVAAGCGKASSSSSGTGGSSSSSGISFAAATTAVSVVGPYSVIVDDFNLDGRPDLVAAGIIDTSPLTYGLAFHRNTTSLGSSAATFAAAQAFTDTLSIMNDPRCVASADFNGDGRPDLVVANLASSIISIFRNATAPGATSISFTSITPISLLSGSRPQSIAIADFNGDGKPDMAVVLTGTNKVRIYLNNTIPGGDPVFVFNLSYEFDTGLSPLFVTAGDLNGDNKPDLAIANAETYPTYGTVTVLLNQTTPAPATSTTLMFSATANYNVGFTANAVSIADLTGDGKPDLVVSNLDSDTLTLFTNTMAPGAGSPSFSYLTPVTLATWYGPWMTVVCDFNGDGRPDIVVTNSSHTTMTVYLNATTAGATAPSFSTASTFSVGNSPAALATGDFNGDGKSDLAFGNFSDGTVAIFLNNTTFSSTAPSFALASSVGMASNPSSIAIRDLDANWTPDIVTSNAGTSNNATFRPNNTAPAATTVDFFSVESVAAGTSPSAVAVADFNGDGKPDLAVANGGAGTVSILLNTTPPGSSPATFSKTDIPACGTTPKSLAISDFNGDGKPDIAVADAGSTTLIVLLSTTITGAATPTFSSNAVTVGVTQQAVAAADFNLDGRVDLAVINQVANTVTVIRNDTAPGAAATTFYSTVITVSLLVGSDPQGLAVADFNGDGFPDIVTANSSSNTVSVILNTTAPGAAIPVFPLTVTSANNFTTGLSPMCVAIGDVNGDGVPDLVTANYTDNSVSVLVNRTVPASGASAILNFDAKIDITTGSGPKAVAVGDINRDWKQDLVTANETAGTASFLLSQ